MIFDVDPLVELTDLRWLNIEDNGIDCVDQSSNIMTIEKNVETFLHHCN